MVRLTKERAKKPIIETGSHYVCDDADFSDRANPKMLYCLQVDDRNPDVEYTKRGSYKLALTEDEMISIATEWLTRYARVRERKRQKEIDDARKQRILEARHSGVPTPEAG